MLSVDTETTCTRTPTYTHSHMPHYFATRARPRTLSRYFSCSGSDVGIRGQIPGHLLVGSAIYATSNIHDIL